MSLGCRVCLQQEIPLNFIFPTYFMLNLRCVLYVGASYMPQNAVNIFRIIPQPRFWSTAGLKEWKIGGQRCQRIQTLLLLLLLQPTLLKILVLLKQGIKDNTYSQDLRTTRRTKTTG